MTNYTKFNAARGGHAPGHLRNALIAALESSEHWCDYLSLSFFDLAQQERWNRSSSVARANWVLGQLWNCDDYVPGSICRKTRFRRASTFARLARRLKSQLHECTAPIDSDAIRSGAGALDVKGDTGSQFD